MVLFKKKLDTCPICDAGIERGGLARHNLGHAIPAPDAASGYVWRCSCGEEEGAWNQPTGAAAGLTQHMTVRHGLTYPLADRLDADLAGTRSVGRKNYPGVHAGPKVPVPAQGVGHGE